MDHMDGIKDLFETFEVLNFWDTENTKVMDDNMSWGRYDKADWDFYQEIRTSLSSPKVLNLYAGQKENIIIKQKMVNQEQMDYICLHLQPIW